MKDLSPNLTFCIENEDHTLGNVVRTILSKKKDVSFAGYTMPHPMQYQVNIRVQTTGKPAIQAMVESLDEMQQVCDQILGEFNRALNTG
ncbi:DNA-directed RNA polymerase III subunit C19 [Babesia microti strain RI]|uniref:DNA-directed RNA polymerase III subunit C19 n=1 Tax=Babesia microti (strain RI) TaxID=1133968 RepID=I7I8V3_BABMR|nr:DNA-directed RNA polymerase III subunit C19 [Babesia microti strain RI]CCF73738.1 DNA-directed RNA polymerase III subunit C19 [Babesia microti strain RI]|eukprot:XP_012648347.1 DNA-directed RNA polymerase III subunit C19 [Babesia microti strain RI]